MDSRGVGPSTLERLTHDRSLRLATGLAVAVAIPVAILFYFQFRSISVLSQTSALVLRQLSQETAEGVTKVVVDALRTTRVDVLDEGLSLVAWSMTQESGFWRKEATAVLPS